MDEERAMRFAEQWCAAWNGHDLEEILAQLEGKEALRRYFAAGLERYPDLRFEPLGLYAGVDSLVVRYESVGGRVAAETIFLDEDDRVTRYFAHYA